jgi:hypothetical protein
MDPKILQEIFHELLGSLEAMDTQSSAVPQFLKDKGIVKPEELAPYLEQAGNASGVRWLGLRVRLDHLFSAAIQQSEDEAAKEASAAAQDKTHTRESEQLPPEQHSNKHADGKASSGEMNGDGAREEAEESGDAKAEENAENELGQPDSQRQDRIDETGKSGKVPEKAA